MQGWDLLAAALRTASHLITTFRKQAMHEIATKSEALLAFCMPHN